MGGLLRLVQRGGDWAGPQPAQTPPRCTKRNNPPINGQCTNFVLFDVTLYLPLASKGLRRVVEAGFTLCYFKTFVNVTFSYTSWTFAHFSTSTCDIVDIDECAVNNGGCTSPLATCVNTPGSSTCTCLPGYTGDGFNCTGKPNLNSWKMAQFHRSHTSYMWLFTVIVALYCIVSEIKRSIGLKSWFFFVRYLHSLSPFRGSRQNIAVSFVW